MHSVSTNVNRHTTDIAAGSANIEPLIATGRQPHHPSWRERFAEPAPAPENPTPVEAMAWRLRTPQGKQLYGLRKHTPEPVFGIIKSAAGITSKKGIAKALNNRAIPTPLGEWRAIQVARLLARLPA
jgi:hypothetical protein